MQYMSFDLSWFTTLPGILITVGLILLLVGMIFYRLSGKKDKGENKEEVPSSDATTTPSEPQVEASADTSAATTPEVVATPEVTPSEPEVSVPAVENSATEEKVESTPIEENPTANTEEAKPEELEVAVPTIEEKPAEEKLEIEVPTEEKSEEKKDDSAVSIYGGASPQVSVTQEEPRKAYGGADPLENTGALPRVEVPAEPATPVVEEKPVEEKVEAKPTEEEPAATVDKPEEEKKEEKAGNQATPTDDIETLEF